MAKKYLKKIADALSGVDSEIPVIRSTPDQKPARPSQGGPQIFRSDRGGIVTDPAQDKHYANNPRFGVTTDMGRRMRDESRAFYDSAKGTDTRNFVEMKGDMAANPDRKFGSGFGDSYGEKSKLVSKNNPRELTPKQLSDFIGQHAAGNHGAQLNDFGAGLKVKNPDGMSVGKPQRPDVMNMREIPASQGGDGPDYIMNGKKKLDGYVSVMDQLKGKTPFNAKEYYKGGDFKSNIKSTKSKFTMSDDDMVIIGTGAAGGAVGDEINTAMDELHEERKQSQSNAHSYWTRKKNGQ